MTTYRAIQVTSPGKLALVDREVTAPKPDHVRIRVEACGICRTDALTVEGLHPAVSYPRVPGHEAVGTIDAVGEGVRAWRVGQRVGVGFLGGACGACRSCRRGDHVTCANQPAIGLTHDGGYAEIIEAQAHGLVAIPDEISSRDAAPLLCAGVTTFTALRNSRARAGDLVAILGLGGLGHLGVQFARAMGFRVAAIARGAGKAALARELGAHHYIDSTTEDAAAALQALGGARAIVATAANSAALPPLVLGLAPRGELIIAGGSGVPMSLDAGPLLFGVRSISGTLTGSPSDTDDTLAFSALQRIRATLEILPLERAADGYARMMRNEARFRIVLE